MWVEAENALYFSPRDDALALALERVGRFFGASLASLCEISAEHQVRVTHWWVAAESGPAVRDRD